MSTHCNESILMLEKQIKKSCIAVGTKFRDEYVNSLGRPTLDFFRHIALCIGGVKGFSSMALKDLPGAIAVRLGVPFSQHLGHSAEVKEGDWFTAVLPVLSESFHRPSNIIIEGLLPEMPDPEGEEGREFLIWHKKVERNARVVRELKQSAADRDMLGFIICQVCRVAPGARFGVETIEAHHIIPVSEAGVRVVSIEDFILVCPNCHSAIHAGARVERQKPRLDLCP